ncbi:M20/M25/M40 family metallo-hydrolase [Paenibacillus koleovorans]|uniref:M20/M25/M40 family metallo-hydrolase n=1 Tax=Paenibacillus koleovorans TaxID=121608 RepID=UPI000FDA995F|nr:M20/M25/M40 family metallo-hydrolase [Paenibacillus koleovorans]
MENRIKTGRDVQAEIQAWVRTHEDATVELISKLVSFDTVNGVLTGTEKELQLYLQQVMEQYGLATDLFSPEEVPGFREHPAYFPGKDYSDRPNLVGLHQGQGGGRSLVFSSHVDTAVVAAGWERDPWTAEREGDRLYGLGTFDMKGGLVASLMALRCLIELGLPPLGDVSIESVVDEEFGGANGTLACRLRGRPADAAIIPEPSNLAVYPASKGGALWRVAFRGTTGLSFSGETVINPTLAASKFIVFLDEYERERGKAGGPAPYYTDDRQLPAIVTRVEAGDMQALLNDVGPSTCSVDIWVECHPGVTEEQLQAELLQRFGERFGEHLIQGEYAPTFTKMIRFLPGSEVEPEFPLIGMLAQLTERVTGRQSDVTGAPFACDAFMFNLYSPTKAIILGPSGANAHAPDEYIEVPALLQLVELYALAIVEWCGVAETA